MAADKGAGRTREFVVRLTPDLDDRLTADAAANERSKAATVRLAIERYLQEERRP